MTDINSGLVGGEQLVADQQTATAQITPPKFNIVLVGRQSYFVELGEYKLIPRVSTLARASSTKVLEAWELYSHFLELADILNTDISDMVDTYNEQVEAQQTAEEEDEVIETGTDDEPTMDFASIFTSEENSFLEPILPNIHKEGYSQVSVYLEIDLGEHEKFIMQPESVEALSRFF